jgi:hypothetical protein
LIDQDVVSDRRLVRGIAQYIAIQTEFQNTAGVSVAPTFQKHFIGHSIEFVETPSYSERIYHVATGGDRQDY